MREHGIIVANSPKFDFRFYQLQGTGAVHFIRVIGDHLKSKDMIMCWEHCT